MAWFCATQILHAYGLLQGPQACIEQGQEGRVPGLALRPGLINLTQSKKSQILSDVSLHCTLQSLLQLQQQRRRCKQSAPPRKSLVTRNFVRNVHVHIQLLPPHRRHAAAETAILSVNNRLISGLAGLTYQTRAADKVVPPKHVRLQSTCGLMTRVACNRLWEPHGSSWGHAI